MYQIFSNDELSRSFDQHISYACSLTQSFVNFETSNIWTVVGEWSSALTDCAQWLNGRGVGARWEGQWGDASGQHVFGSCNGYTGNYSTFSQNYKDQMRKYFEVQTEVGEQVQGWVFWTWKVRPYTHFLSGLSLNDSPRPRTQMIGAIARGWKGVGSPPTPRTGFILIFVRDPVPFCQHPHCRPPIYPGARPQKYFASI